MTLSGVKMKRLKDKAKKAFGLEVPNSEVLKLDNSIIRSGFEFGTY